MGLLENLSKRLGELNPRLARGAAGVGGHADVKTTMRYLHHKSRAGEAELLAGAFRACRRSAGV